MAPETSKETGRVNPCSAQFTAVLTMIRLHDEATWRHSHRVAAVTRQLGLACGIRGTDLRILVQAALLHDIGKKGVDQDILSKPSQLSASESRQMRSHPETGYLMLRGRDSPEFKLAAKVAMGHHEQWSGGGYPFGLSGDAVPLEARLVGLADCYEALRAPRSYKSGCDHDATMEWIEERSGTQFDPDLVDLALGMSREISARWETAYAAMPEPDYPGISLMATSYVPAIGLTA